MWHMFSVSCSSWTSKTIMKSYLPHWWTFSTNIWPFLSLLFSSTRPLWTSGEATLMLKVAIGPGKFLSSWCHCLCWYKSSNPATFFPSRNRVVWPLLNCSLTNWCQDFWKHQATQILHHWLPSRLHPWQEHISWIFLLQGCCKDVCQTGPTNWFITTLPLWHVHLR